MPYLNRLPLFCCFLPLISSAFSAEPPAPVVPHTVPPAHVVPHPEVAPPADPWLEEVRRQREAWEARRDAAKAASKARLRLFDPWRAAQLEALDQEAELRREFARERAEQRRISAETVRGTHRRSLEQRQTEEQQMLDYFAPYGWDNRWYYRGW